MRYNSERLEIRLVISGNVLLFKGIEISLGLVITAQKMHALFRENHCLECQQLHANNRDWDWQRRLGLASWRSRRISPSSVYFGEIVFFVFKAC